jgi:hypothetical protein
MAMQDSSMSNLALCPAADGVPSVLPEPTKA